MIQFIVFGTLLILLCLIYVLWNMQKDIEHLQKCISVQAEQISDLESIMFSSTELYASATAVLRILNGDIEDEITPVKSKAMH
jgi:hypothetical protein